MTESFCDVEMLKWKKNSRIFKTELRLLFRVYLVFWVFLGNFSRKKNEKKAFSIIKLLGKKEPSFYGFIQEWLANIFLYHLMFKFSRKFHYDIVCWKLQIWTQTEIFSKLFDLKISKIIIWVKRQLKTFPQYLPYSIGWTNEPWMHFLSLDGKDIFHRKHLLDSNDSASFCVTW